MDAPLPGLVSVLLVIGGLLLFIAGYVLGKDAGVRQAWGEMRAMLLVALVAGREKGRE